MHDIRQQNDLVRFKKDHRLGFNNDGSYWSFQIRWKISHRCLLVSHEERRAGSLFVGPIHLPYHPGLLRSLNFLVQDNMGNMLNDFVGFRCILRYSHECWMRPAWQVRAAQRLRELRGFTVSAASLLEIPCLSFTANIHSENHLLTVYWHSATNITPVSVSVSIELWPGLCLGCHNTWLRLGKDCVFSVNNMEGKNGCASNYIF